MCRPTEKYEDKYVVNFTGETFWAYAYDGTPIKIRAEKNRDRIPPYPELRIVLIVDDEQYQKLKESGRETRDLAKLSEPMKGKDNLTLRMVIMYDNEKVRVMPINNSLLFASNKQN